jgi:hypothetical protein
MKSSNRILRSSLALTAVTAAGSARADVQWSGPVDLSVAPGQELTFDLNGDAADDYRFLFANNNASKPSVTNVLSSDLSRLVLVDLNGVTDAGTNGFPVTPAGTTIDSFYLNGGSNWEGFFYQNGDNQLSGGFYNDGNGDTGYIGLSISSEAGTNYGWAHMTFSPIDGTLTLHDYAYETDPGVGIVTGVVAVPEPSSIALLAAGVGGLALLRARRKAA